MINPANNEGNPSEQFAEGESVALAALRTLRRADQQAIYNAAWNFAENYETVTGKRVKQLLQAAEMSEDPDTFNRRLDEILAEQPPKSAMQTLTRSLFFSNLLGALRSNRKTA